MLHRQQRSHHGHVASFAQNVECSIRRAVVDEHKVRHAQRCVMLEKCLQPSGAVLYQTNDDNIFVAQIGVARPMQMRAAEGRPSSFIDFSDAVDSLLCEPSLQLNTLRTPAGCTRSASSSICAIAAWPSTTDLCAKFAQRSVLCIVAIRQRLAIAPCVHWSQPPKRSRRYRPPVCTRRASGDTPRPSVRRRSMKRAMYRRTATVYVGSTPVHFAHAMVVWSPVTRRKRQVAKRRSGNVTIDARPTLPATWASSSLGAVPCLSGSMIGSLALSRGGGWRRARPPLCPIGPR